MQEAAAIVVGAGVSGLCAAHYLAKQLGPEKVLVLESGDAPGGTARSSIEDGYVLEWGPNGFLDKEPKTLDWVEELGLKAKLIRANEAAAHRFVFKRNALHEIIGPPKFLLSPLLSVKGRARLLCEPFIPGKSNDTAESIWDFAARRIGREAADTMVGPMVSGIFGGDAKQLSLQHCFPKMFEMERQYGGLYKALRAKRRANPGASPMGPSGVLTCFPQGIQHLAQRAAERLGERLRLNTALEEVTREGEKYVLRLSDGTQIRTRNLVIAAPAYAAGKFLRPLDEELAGVLNDIPYASIAVLCTGYDRAQVRHPLNGFGFLIPRTEGLRALGCLWTSSIFPEQAPKGKVLLRTMFGGATDPEAVKLSDGEMLELLQRELGEVLGIQGKPELQRVFRWHRGIPQYDLRHGERLTKIEQALARHPGLALAGNAYRGVGLNDCVLSAHAAVERVAGMHTN